ncbi:hypothetical protein [Bauldia sp.]|uniref:hypothetical protein n=1 Tax=Bauldia sp. TaxID=2575872 RepID=UPI003BA8E800
MTIQRRQAKQEGRGDFDDREAVVTYSRIEDDPGSLHGIGDREPAGPLYEAVEVPQMERPDAREPFFAGDGMPVEPEYGDDLDPLEPEQRNRTFRHLIVIGIGVVALAAGAGILIATIGSSGRVDTAAPGTVPAAATDGATEAATADPGIRAIPLGEAPGGPDIDLSSARPAEPIEAAATPPPEPRPRPEPPAETAAVAPETDATPTAEAMPAPAAAVAPAPQGDDFIRSIEQTLSNIRPEPAPAAVVPETLPAPGDAPAAAPADTFTTVTAPVEPLPQATLTPTAPQPTPVRVLPDGTVVYENEALPAEAAAVEFDENAAAIDGGGHFDFELEQPAVTVEVPALPDLATGGLPAIPDVPGEPATLEGLTIDLEPAPAEPHFIPPEAIPEVPDTIGLQ